ncbi:MAG: LCP family protein [Lachnospiraceae bacterium]|nr:LCP family protein [Lachnospiraceae bacterium]
MAENKKSTTNRSNAAKTKSSKKAKQKRNRTIIIAIEAVVILIAAIAAIVIWAMDKKGGNEGAGSNLISTDVNKENLAVNEELENEDFWNIALFGVDSRTGVLGKGTLSDCIIVCSINKNTKEVKLVSVYRDTYLNIGNDTYNKANSAYSSGGPEQAIKMLNTNLDLDITNFATVDFSALVSVVDAIGGVTIDLTEEEITHLNNYQVETSKVTNGKIENVSGAGEHLLNGIQTVSYCRIRYTAGDDFKRSERQRQVIGLIIEKAKTMSPTVLTKIVEEAFPKCATNIELNELLSLVKDISSYKIVDTTGFPFDKKNDILGSRGDCVIPIGLEQNVVQLHEYLFGTEEEYTPSASLTAISSKIVNDTGVVPPEKTEEDVQEQEQQDESQEEQ